MNPLQMLGAMKNPQAFVQNMMNNNQVAQNPLAMNALELYKNGDEDGLKQMAENLCHEKGISIDEVKAGLMKHLGMQ